MIGFKFSTSKREIFLPKKFREHSVHAKMRIHLETIFHILMGTDIFVKHIRENITFTEFLKKIRRIIYKN